MNEALTQRQLHQPHHPAQTMKQEKSPQASHLFPMGNLNPPGQGSLNGNMSYPGHLNLNQPYHGAMSPFLSQTSPSNLPGGTAFVQQPLDTNNGTSSWSLFRTLTEEEKQIIETLEKNFRTAVETPCKSDHDHCEIAAAVAHMDGIYNTIAMTWAKMFLKFIKTVEDFRSLDIDTQIKSLKACIRCCLMIIAAYTYDTKENNLVLYDIKISLEEFKKTFTVYKETTEKLVSIFLGMQTEVFKDPSLMAIFEMVIVFYPAWDNVGQRTNMSNLQDKYHILLKHYLEAKYSFAKGKEYFALILKKFNFMKQVATERKEIIANMGADKLAPFAKELFEVNKE